jgi:chromosome segregation ATPase
LQGGLEAMRILIFVLSVLCAQSKKNYGADKDSVVQKVIVMLQENKIKVMNDLKEEETEMAEYSKYCDDEADAKAYSIKTATRKIADLNAEIDDAAAQVRSLEDEIALLGTEMAAKSKELSDAGVVRKKDRDNFSKTEAAMLDTVGALEKAIVLVKRSAGFLQTEKPHGAKAYAKQIADALRPVVNAAWVDKGSIQVLKGFIQDRDQDASGSDSSDDLQLHMNQPSEAKEASGGIMQVLEDMKEKAQETLSNARMEEMKANHNYQMMTASLKSSLDLAAKKLSDCKATTASLTESSGKATGELAETKKSKLADSMYLDNLKLECSQAAKEWAERQKSANGEIAAIEKAKEILQSKVKVLVQFPDADDGASVDDAEQAAMRHRLVDELQGMGHKFKSYAMMELASAATQDPFMKIRGLIEDMVAKLVAEANEEATQKDFCDEEKAKSSKEQAAKTMRADDLRARIDSATSAKEELSEKIKELHAEIAEIDDADKEATKIRTEEAATNKKAIKDFKDGASAVEEAIRVLKEYYASTPPSLIQTNTKKPSFAQTKGDAANTIIAFLETSAEDFSRMATEIETDEGEAAAAYTKTMKESKAAKTSKKDEIEGAESEIKVLTVTIEGDNEDLKMVNKELDAVMGYIDKLKPQCETKIMTYEEKRAKRQEEIEGLKEALSILDAPGAAAFAQVKKH